MQSRKSIASKQAGFAIPALKAALLGRLKRRPSNARLEDAMRIQRWEYKERNRLVHALVTLNNYDGMDSIFMALAKQGKPLVAKLYDETTAFRNKYYEASTMSAFPADAMEKCRLCKKHKEEN